MGFKVNLLGQKFERLEVIKYVGGSRWECKCDCGNTSLVMTRNLRNGNTKSCGCIQKEVTSKAHKTHGFADSSTYNVWRTMRDRCSKPKNASYVNYGGRGIKVCERWQKFENFICDMGEKPHGFSIERIDVNGDYSPENCMWIPLKDQANNRRNSKFLEYDGERLTLSQWSRKLGFKPFLIGNRLAMGWSVAKTLTTPVGAK